MLIRDRAVTISLYRYKDRPLEAVCAIFSGLGPLVRRGLDESSGLRAAS